MAQTTLATAVDVIRAGNLSKKIDEGTIEFWIDVAAFMLGEAVGVELYAYAVANITYYPKLIKAETLMAVALCLPSIAIVSSTSGFMRSLSMGSNGYFEVFSFTKEVIALSNFYSSMAQQFMAEYITDENQHFVWSKVVQRVFPGLDEYPTQGTIRSADEGDIQGYRGSTSYVKD
jgi:hypothetical protein